MELWVFRGGVTFSVFTQIDDVYLLPLYVHTLLTGL